MKSPLFSLSFSGMLICLGKSLNVLWLRGFREGFIFVKNRWANDGRLIEGFFKDIHTLFHNTRKVREHLDSELSVINEHPNPFRQWLILTLLYADWEWLRTVNPWSKEDVTNCDDFSETQVYKQQMLTMLNEFRRYTQTSHSSTSSHTLHSTIRSCELQNTANVVSTF